MTAAQIATQKALQTEPVFAVNNSKPKDYSEKACCTSEVLSSSCYSMTSRDVISISPAVNHVEFVASEPLAISVTQIDNADIKSGPFEVEHIVSSVQGMICTGCEKKLYRSFNSLPAISNIKTSIVLSQAEFDLSRSTSINSVNVIKAIEKMTGFTCTKLIQSGEELDLVAGCNVQDFAQGKDWPRGVTDLAILSKNSIRITYQPRIIGAREVLSNPFFRFTTLAPSTARPLITSGRAHVRKTFFMTLLSASLTIPVLISILPWVWVRKSRERYTD